MTKCPWCKAYLESYLKDNGSLTEKELEDEKERLKAGFWASIKQVHDEQYLANKAWNTETALKMRMPIQIDMRSGETFLGRFCCSLAEERDKVSNEEVEHLWILSGGCSMSWMTPICCELANVTSDLEQLEWEIEEFDELKDLTRKIVRFVEEEYYEHEDRK